MKTSGIIFIDKPPLLTDAQLNRLSEICIVIGEVFFASAVITPLVAGIDDSKFPVVLSGVVLSVFSWIVSILLVRKL